MSVASTKYENFHKTIPLRVARGHFASNHSHMNYYIDLTMTRSRLSEARQAAIELASSFKGSTVVDTILCLDGMQVIGSCMASELTKAGFISINAHQTIYVATPEHTVGSQLIFRENAQCMIRGKHVLILAASVTTGYTAQEAVNTVRYYDGTPVGICSIFSVVDECAGFPVTSIFNTNGLLDYKSVPASSCPMCKAGQKLDAMVNTYGISSF